MPKGQTSVNGLELHSSINPSIVGPKAIFFCPSCVRFFRELGNVVDISIWSSMRFATTKFICDFHLRHLLLLVKLLGQKLCNSFTLYDSQGKVAYMKVKRTYKLLFLKALQKN
jgi:hypothetical protein